jgi:hypothetical protein
MFDTIFELPRKRPGGILQYSQGIPGLMRAVCERLR